MNKFWLGNFFKMFWTVLDFLQKPLAWFSKFYLRVQSKNCGRNGFFVFLFRIFFGVSAKDFQTFGQKTSRSCQIYLPRVRMNKFWLGNFFKMFWTVLDFLQKPLAWFSKFYLRVQSKNCGRNGFFVFLFRFFFEFWAKIFQNFGQETSRKCQNNLLRVQTNNFWLEETFKSLEPFCVFCRNLWNGSQNSIYVSRVKSPEETVFLTFLFRFFSSFERNIFRLLAKKLQEVVKTTLCVFTRTIFGLKFFSKILNRFGFSAENLAWFSNFYLRVHSKNSGRNNFFNLLFKIFSDFERIFFRLSAKKLQEVFKTNFYVSRGTRCGLNFFKKNWIVLDFLQKLLAWFSKFYLRV